MRWLVAAVAVAASLTGAERIAAAWDCDTYYSLPIDGAVDVPLNTRVVLFLAGYEHRTNFYQLARQSDGRLIASAVSQVTPGDYVLTPEVELEPMTTYEIIVDLGDYAPRVSTFTTGATVDVLPPAFDGIRSLRLETMSNGDFLGPMDDPHPCLGVGWHGRIMPDFDELEPDVAYLELEWYQPAYPDRPLARISRAWRDMVRDCCTELPVLIPFATWCARLVAYDLAGNTAGREQLQCAQVVQCETMYDGTGTNWNNLLPECIEKAAPASDSEASGCRSGHESWPGAGLLLAFAALLIRRRRSR